MSLIITSAADSAQGYGMFRGVSSTATSYTFPSGTSTWTAPTGVTNLASAVGKGADGTASSWGTQNIGYSLVSTFPTSGYTSTLDWSTVYAEAQALLSAANAGGSGERTYNPAYYYIRDINASNLTTPRATLTYNYTIRGTATLIGDGSAKTSGQVLYSDGSGSWNIDCQVFSPGSSGADTTGFGLTFPGGTPSVPAAPTTTFNNTAVVPGTTYTIVNNGSLTITYFA